MLQNLGARLAVQYRLKIGGLDPRKRTSQSGKEWQAPVKWDHFRITTNERGQDGNFKIATEIMQHYAREGEKPEDAKPREVNVVLFSDDLRDVYDDWRAYYRGRKCQCRSMDGEVARWNHQEAQVPDFFEIIGKENGYTLIKCPGDACSFTQKEQCKINLILNVMIKEAPEIGGAAQFRATSVNSALQIRGSLHLLHHLTGGHIAGIPLKLRLEPRHTEKGVVYVVHLTYPADVLSLKQKAIEYSKTSKQYDETLVKLISAKSVADSETEEEIAEVVKEYYSETAKAELDKVNAVTGEIITPQSDDPLDALFEGNEEAQAEREKTEQGVEETQQDVDKSQQTHTEGIMCPKDGDSADPRYCEHDCPDRKGCEAYAGWQRATKTMPEPPEEKKEKESSVETTEPVQQEMPDLF